MYDQPIQWLKNLFLPLLTAEFPDPSQVVQDIERATSETGATISLIILAVVLLMCTYKLRSVRLVAGHAVYLLPFIGLSVGLITISEAVFVFALEVIVYFGIFVAISIYKTLVPKRRSTQASDGTITEHKGFSFWSLIARVVLICVCGGLTYMTVYSAVRLGGSAEYYDRIVHGAIPYEAANYRAHHDQLMRLQHECLGLSDPTDEQLEHEARQQLLRFENLGWDHALSERWKEDILVGDCTAPMRTQSPWFMFLCLFALLLKEWLQSGIITDYTRRATLPVRTICITLRILYITGIPLLICGDIDDFEHIAVMVVLFAAVQRTLMTWLTAPSDELDVLDQASMDSRLSSLEPARLFAELTVNDRKELAALTTEKRFGPGEAIVSQGQSVAELYVIVSGRVHISGTASDESSGVEEVEIGPGACVGLSAALQQSNSSVTAKAIDSVSTLCITWDQLNELFGYDKEIASRFWRAAAADLSQQLPGTKRV